MKRRARSRNTCSRRDVIRALMGSGAALALGCGGKGATGAVSDMATGSSADAADAASSCTATPEGEIGPYFADDSDARFNRADILANLDGTNVQTGIPLTLTITVLDSEKGCAPYAGAQVDIWHCNSAGVYSDQAVESTTTEQWLRGYQLTDAAGRVSFTTIVPGWYAGRTTHIHLRLRSSYSEASSTSDGTNTTQLFFAQSFVDRLATAVAPYDAEGTNPTTNASDHVYSGETNGANLLTLSGDDTNGYSAAVTIYLPITGDGTTTGGNPGGGPPDGGGTFPGGGGVP